MCMRACVHVCVDELGTCLDVPCVYVGMRACVYS